MKLLGCKSVVRHKLLSGTRKGTFHTTSTNLSSSQSGDKRKSGRIKDDSDTITASIVIKNGVEDVVVINSETDRLNEKCEMNDSARKLNGFTKRKRSTFEDIDEIEEICNVKRMDSDDEAIMIRKKMDKDVVFTHQNGQFGCNTQKRHPSTSSGNIYSRHKLHSVLISKRSESMESSTDDNEPYSDNHTRSRYSIDENRIGTESFV